MLRMIIKKGKKRQLEIKERHIYVAVGLITVITSLITLYFTNGCAASMVLFSGFGSATIMILLTNTINNWIDRKERKEKTQNEDED